MKKVQEKNSGITLVALVITIIILLILAGISISALTGSGLFQKASDATRISQIKEIEETARLSYMGKQINEIDGGEKTAIEKVINDLKEKGYTIKEVTGGTNNITGVKLNKSEISMQTKATGEIAYEYEYSSETIIRYFAEVQEKNYEIIFNNGDITVSTVETDLSNINKLPEVTVTSSNGEIVEVQKTEEGKIKITSKEKSGEATITVICAGKPVTLIVTVKEPLFTGVDKTITDPENAMPSGEVAIVDKNLSNGIVIETTTSDNKKIQWVWIVVPKTEFKTVKELKEEKTEEEITKQELNEAIKADLIAYAGAYRRGTIGQSYSWIDEYYVGCGIDEPKTYTAIYNKMLNSVYTNGGFWIQRYEDGEVNITCANAQIKASGYAPDLTKTSSLLFGIQWDLVCKYLEVSVNWPTPPSGKTNTYYLNEDSSTWGRYLDTAGDPSTPKSGLLRNKRMNIYDFAGNLYEWTLEHATSLGDRPHSVRGGAYYNPKEGNPASNRGYNKTSETSIYHTFRSTFY